MIRDAYLPADHHMMTHPARPRYAGLRGNHRVRSNLDVVPNVDKIIEFDAFGDAGVVQRAAIDGRVRPNFDVIGDLHDADLRKFPVAAFSVDVPETVRANHGSRVNLNAMAHPGAGVHGRVRMDAAIFANPASRADYAMRTNLRALADMRVFANHRVRADAHIFFEVG